MGKLEDFIDTLEGRDDLDLKEVVSEMLKLHNEEIDTREAKISDLSTKNETFTNTIAEKDSEIVRWKAKNWDLVNQVPAEGQNKEPVIDEKTGLPDAANITLDDLFEN